MVVGLFTLSLLLVMGGAHANDDKVVNEVERYNNEISKTYDFKFGPNPFTPGNATTITGTFIPGEMFVLSKRCGTCHTDAHAQWRQSAHGNAFREPFYQKNVKDLQNQRGIEFTRHCESCHNPAALFSGALTKNSKVKRPFDDDGVSCIACHAIESVDGRGIGGYVMAEPALLVKEDGKRLLAGVTDQNILDDIPSHKRAMMRPLLKQPEFCGACHKSQVPRELNDYKFLRAFMVADELQMSSFSKESPHPYYTRDKETCNSCHMKREPAPLFDVSAKEGKLATHRWAAANTAIPYFYKWPEQLDAVTKFLENDALGIDIFAIRRKPAADAEKFIAPVNRNSFAIAAGDQITADVVITNKNIGHSFPPELRDFYEAYVEFAVIDGSGKVLYQSGFIKSNGHLDESAHNYKTYLVKADGSYNDKHHIWRTRVVAQNNVIHSGRSDMARYQFRIPSNATGALKLTARVKYRRFTRVFSDYSLGKSVDYPIVTMATAQYALQIGSNSAMPPNPSDKTAMPDWRRWNNYGIALFDQRQYALAIAAFTRAAELDEKYRPMALVNRAMAHIELEQYEEAASILESVVKTNPTNPRALFQQARIFLKRGQLDQAESNLKQVLAAYPRDRISLQQLGELCKIRRDYKGALECYQKILHIDPEDLGAHYNLMLVYRKLGRLDDAKREAKIFADLKDDPSALSIANQFLRKHPEMSNESVYWHVHDLSRTPGD
ncbi:MAG TPA: tetratricopeptide repeat protein [Pyrinomonadaceae bacterium]|nr:tetratricopeptide repeat protein [Pyrinomonadaceae bacterium]